MGVCVWGRVCGGGCVGRVCGKGCVGRGVGMAACAGVWVGAVFNLMPNSTNPQTSRAQSSIARWRRVGRGWNDELMKAKTKILTLHY